MRRRSGLAAKQELLPPVPMQLSRPRLQLSPVAQHSALQRLG
jgi:hypothetical protein